jgi:RNA polymerase sigma factor (sigma-70 family)
MKSKYKNPNSTETLKWWEKLEDGDESAFKALFYQYSFVPQRLTRRYRWANNYQDLLNTGFEALTRSIRSFNRELCNNFMMWCVPQIKTAIGRAKYAEKKWGGKETVSSEIEWEVDLELDFIETELEELLSLFLRRLERTPRLVITHTYGLYHQEPKTIRQIAADLNIPPTRVWKTRKIAMNQLRKMFQVHANNLII